MIALPQWLRDHGLEQHLDLFERNEIDFSTLRILTEQEQSELEQLALVVPAVDAMVDEIYRLGRAPVLQDLLQARVVGGSRTLAVAWLKRRFSSHRPPRPLT